MLDKLWEEFRDEALKDYAGSPELVLFAKRCWISGLMQVVATMAGAPAGEADDALIGCLKEVHPFATAVIEEANSRAPITQVAEVVINRRPQKPREIQ